MLPRGWPPRRLNQQRPHVRGGRPVKEGSKGARTEAPSRNCARGAAGEDPAAHVPPRNSILRCVPHTHTMPARPSSTSPAPWALPRHALPTLMLTSIPAHKVTTPPWLRLVRLVRLGRKRGSRAESMPQSAYTSGWIPASRHTQRTPSTLHSRCRGRHGLLPLQAHWTRLAIHPPSTWAPSPAVLNTVLGRVHPPASAPARRLNASSQPIIPAGLQSELAS